VNSFHPPVRVLMGPGPSEVSARVLMAQARPTIGHLDPAFQSLMEETKAGLQRLFRAPNHACIPLPGPGTCGMEAGMMNLLEPGDVAVVAINGLFGQRMADMAERAGAEVVRVEQTWGKPIDPKKVEAALWARGAKLLAFVHAETSTGAMTDPAPLCALAREHGALTVVDCVTSLGGIHVNAEEWGADVLYSGTQKCLSAPPGLAPFAISAKAQAVVKARKTKPRNWLYDLQLLMSYWGGEGGRAYHHTAPVNAVYGLHEAMVALFEEGQEAVIARHLAMHQALVAGLGALGLDLQVAKAHRLPQLNTVKIPEGVDEAQVRLHMLTRFGVEIGAGLGPLKGKVWRIGVMGSSATPRHIRVCLTALADALAAQGRNTASVQGALDAAEHTLAPHG
jgi:alanine-glyoxylate transaminase/serine-glyoxylate transaminase/serine-pyruvate transaminase